MELLDKILDAELKQAEFGAIASKLKRQYADENAKFKIGDVVNFKKSYEDRLFNGKICSFKFDTSPVGIRYTVNVISKNGKISRSDPGFYYISEKELMQLNK